MTSIELLSPARNLECGIAAIDHGADAVYIGAPRFGARAAAGNSVSDIRTLCAYAHRFGARVYVTLNTILFDDELEETKELVWDLYRTGVDALIVQDMSLLMMELPPIPLHASTQTDNRTPQKVRQLQELGFQQVVLARELSLSQIKEIHQAVPGMPLEAFVHGALCVSYSGQCYASQYCFGRSANRGECAQFCRLPFSLLDADGHTIVSNRYLLSLRDMNRSKHIEEMIEAGVRSFKIEGRLKDVSYVKNVTAYYRQCIDAVLKRNPRYVRASYGRETFTFQPNPSRSFSRGFTDYFLHGRTKDVASPDTPKSRGEYVGDIKEIRRDCIIVSGISTFSNGDGMCYIDAHGDLQGFRVNRAEGNHLYPAQMPPNIVRTKLYRNYDHEWETILSKPSAERRIPLSMSFTDTPDGFALSAVREDGTSLQVAFQHAHQQARTDQTESIRQVLSKVGNTRYVVENLHVSLSEPYFIPRSLLADWRRDLLEKLDDTPLASRFPHPSDVQPSGEVQPMLETLTYLANVSNALSTRFYNRKGVSVIEPALEVQSSAQEPHSSHSRVLMFCRHCIRFEMGWCMRHQHARSPYPEPFFLQSNDGRRFLLEFDCRNCQMLVRST